MSHTKFQVSETSGSEAEDLEYFLHISMVLTWDPWPGTILDPGTFI